MQNNHTQTLAQIDEQVTKFKKKYKMDINELPTNILLNSFSSEPQNNFTPSSYTVSSGATAANAAVEELDNDRNNFDTIGGQLEILKTDVRNKKPENIDELMREIEKLEVDIAALRERNLELKKELDLLILHQKKEQEHKLVKSENEQLQDKIKKIREGSQNVKSDVEQSFEEIKNDQKKRANITYSQDKKMEKKLDYKNEGHTL
ncbi:MAG: hypothetical protein PHX65_07820 [Sulfurimonas sp.]|nr:hypothetical protein [Sulfurimonas sp.]